MIPRDLWLYGAKVDALRVRLRMGLQGFADSLREVIELGAWRCFITDVMEAPVQHERFEDFVTAPPPAGLGATMEQIRRLLRDRPDVLDLVDQVTVQGQGRPARTAERTVENRDNITVFSPDSDPERGTSATYALRRLRRERPDLHARVLAGELSPHRAMVEAGFRPPTRQVRPSVESFVRAAYQLLSPEQRRELAKKLLDEHAVPANEQRRRPLPDHRDAEA